MAQCIVIELGNKEKAKLRRKAQRTKDAALKTRYLIVLLYARGLGAKRVAATLQCAVSTAARVARRFEAMGEA